MYTILLNETNELIVSVKERIMQRSKLVDNLHFLVDPVYKGIEMADFTVMMEYLTPIGREYKTEILVKSEALYKDKLEYKLPLDTNITKEHGDVELQLTFIKVTLNEDGTNTQQVRKTSTTVLTILPISAWSDIIADSALTALDQRLIQTQAMLEAVDEMNQMLCETKADNIYYNETEKYIQLTANGNPIGDKVVLNISDEKVCVKYINVNENGELIVTYSDDTTENAGKVVEDFVSGIYIPDVSKDGMLTMTLSQNVGEPSYTWDIDRSNDWNEIEGVESSTNYYWEEL